MIYLKSFNESSDSQCEIREISDDEYDDFVKNHHFVVFSDEDKSYLSKIDDIRIEEQHAILNISKHIGGSITYINDYSFIITKNDDEYYFINLDVDTKLSSRFGSRNNTKDKIYLIDQFDGFKKFIDIVEKFIFSVETDFKIN